MITKLSILQLQDKIIERFNSSLTISQENVGDTISLANIITSKGTVASLEQLSDSSVVFITNEGNVSGLAFISNVSEDGSEISIGKTIFNDLDLTDYAKANEVPTLEQFEDLEALLGTDVDFTTDATKVIPAINELKEALDGVEEELNYLQDNTASSIEDFVNTVNSYDRFEFKLYQNINMGDENSPHLMVSALMDDHVAYVYTSDEDFLDLLDEQDVQVGNYKFRRYILEADLTGVAYEDEDNVFSKIQTFEAGIKIGGDVEVKLTDNDDVALDITGEELEVEGVATQTVSVENKGTINVITNNGELQYNGAEVATKSDIFTKVSELENDSEFVSKSDLESEIATALTSAVIYKGSVATYEDLPTVDVKNGYFYNVTLTGINYVWNEEENVWDDVKGIIDFSDLEASIEANKNSIETIETDAAFVNKSNTFSEENSFEAKIIVDGTAGICITGDVTNPDALCSTIKGFETEVDGVTTFNTEFDSKGDLDFNVGDYKLTKNGIALATTEDISTIVTNSYEITVVEGSLEYNVSTIYTSESFYHNLYLNGLRLNREKDYTFNNDTKIITFVSSVESSDNLEMEIFAKGV